MIRRLLWWAMVWAMTGPLWAQDTTPVAAEIAELRAALREEARQIAELREEVAAQKRTLALLTPQGAASSSIAAPVVSALHASAPETPIPAAASQEPETGPRSLGGFRVSGTFLYAFDMQARAANTVAPTLQNLRSRYRLQAAADKQLSSAFDFHAQLSTGPLNNQLTILQDFGGISPKSPFSISEAWVAFHPSKTASFRIGRMEEPYMDGTRLLIDENIRFNGFEETLRLPLHTRVFNQFEVRAGEYILSNPNVVSASPNSPYIAAGYKVGDHIGSANLFHPGITLRGTLNKRWSHRLTATAMLYRNVNQIQLASTPGGAQTTGDAVGLVLSTPLSGAGNATTTPGGAVYWAGRFRIAHLNWRLESSSFMRFRGKPVPGFLDLQISRNLGTYKLRDAVMGSVSLGAIHKRGDVRGMYQFTIKDANSMVSQITDDDLGTATGVNLAVHSVRVDVGLTSFLQWQNMFYLQHQKSASNPEDHFYVPQQRGANPTFRLFSQLVWTF